MDIAALAAISQPTAVTEAGGSGSVNVLTGDLKTDGSLFDSFLDTAVSNIKTTNNYLSDWENEQIKWALGETENTHDLTIALQKASTALQYTVAIRDRLLDAYKEIMNIQI